MREGVGSRTRISFTHKYSKLELPFFHTVRWTDFDVRVGNCYDLFLIANNVFHTKYGKGKFQCVKAELSTIEQLSDQFIKEDADCDRKSFLDMMRGWYSKKPDWKEEKSNVIIIWLQKEGQKLLGEEK